MAFLRCPACGILRIPEENLVHLEVEPDEPKKLTLVMHVLFALRMLWLGIVIPGIRDKAIRLFDVGCGDGQFLDKLHSLGYHNIVGIEPNARRAEHARGRGLQVFPDVSSARSAGKLPEAADLIIFWHVLEHIPQPMSVLGDYAPLLAPDGMFVISVPNHMGWQTRIFGQYSAYPDYGRHIWYHGAGFQTWLARALPDLCVTVLPDLNVEYEVFGWVESIASWIVGKPTFMVRVLKKNIGSAAEKAMALLLAAVLLPLAGVLALMSLAARRGSTLTFCLQRTAHPQSTTVNKR